MEHCLVGVEGGFSLSCLRSGCFLVLLSTDFFCRLLSVPLVLEAEWGPLPEGFTGGGWTRLVAVLVGVLACPGDFLGDFVDPSKPTEVVGWEVTFGVLALVSGLLRGAEPGCESVSVCV